MADYPLPHYSKKEVQRVGKILRGPIPWEDGCSDQAAQVFKIAYDWRNSHAYPMRRIRQELAGRTRRLKIDAITAARTKRMKSIRKKLARTTITLTQIQDLGGCRAIVDSITDMQELVAAYRNGASVHQLRNDTSYVEAPKLGGYRSHHFVLSYQGDEGDEIYDGRRIEIQIRTRLQHAWATAVEAVGLVRKEDLKAGEGNADWLRLFELMASELAAVEKCPLIPGTPDSIMARRSEIRHLDSSLGAVRFLRNLRHAFREAENFMAKDARFFLIQYDGEKEEVRIRGFVSSVSGANVYDIAEQPNSSSIDTVLVEVDKVENLRDAYPNYYLDVSMFTEHLGKAVGNSGQDHSWLTSYKRAR